MEKIDPHSSSLESIFRSFGTRSMLDNIVSFVDPCWEIFFSLFGMFAPKMNHKQSLLDWDWERGKETEETSIKIVLEQMCSAISDLSTYVSSKVFELTLLKWYSNFAIIKTIIPIANKLLSYPYQFIIVVCYNNFKIQKIYINKSRLYLSTTHWGGT